MALRLYKKGISLFQNILSPRFCHNCFSLLRHAYICNTCALHLHIELTTACMICGRRKVPTEPIEKTCCSSIAKTLFSLGSYETSILSQLIKKAKIQKQTDIYAFFASFFSLELESYTSQLASYTLVPIPSFPKTKRLRGFNQAQLFALGLHRYLNLPLSEPMVKLKDTTPQHTLSAFDRFSFIEGAFGIKPGSDIPLSILLVDDVKTTGATLREAARVLKTAGATQICAITIAS